MHRVTLSAVSLMFAFAGAAFAEQKAGVTGECKDGTVTNAQSKEGACSSHGGVKSWHGPKPAAATERPADATGQCNDGTFSTAPSKSGACSGHKGVRDWYTNKDGPFPKKEATTEKAADKGSKDATSTGHEGVGGKTSGTRASTADRPDRAAGGGAGKVWVNTKSNVYHCEKDRWYGKTKSGEYMSEADAKAKGNHADHGKACSA